MWRRPRRLAAQSQADVGLAPFDLLDYFAATETVRLYADQGSAVPLHVTRNGSDANLWGGSYTVSGYLVDMP
jgi:hypothetical protein